MGRERFEARPAAEARLPPGFCSRSGSLPSMDRDLLRHLPVVLAVARRGSFSSAAAELGMTASAVSHAVRLVEERLGQPLFARTTRSVALTEAGEALVEVTQPALEDMAARIDRLRISPGGGVAGHLRLNAPRVALPMVLAEVLERLRLDHPALRVEVTADDGLTDIVAAGFDAGIRLGAMVAQDMIALRLTNPFRVIVVGSPNYLEARGRPEHLADLGRHDCIGYRLVSAGCIYRWEMQEGGEDRALELDHRLVVNDVLIGLDLARRGLGLAYVFAPLVEADLAAGRLEAVLTNHVIEEPGLFLYHPQRSIHSPKLRALVGAARAVRRIDATAR